MLDSAGYAGFLDRETTANKFPDVEQTVRARYKPERGSGPPFVRIVSESTSPQFREPGARAFPRDPPSSIEHSPDNRGRGAAYSDNYRSDSRQFERGDGPYWEDRGRRDSFEAADYDRKMPPRGARDRYDGQSRDEAVYTESRRNSHRYEGSAQGEADYHQWL